MTARTRTVTGLLLVLLAVIASAFFLHLFPRVGFPQIQDGAKGVMYLWLLTLTIALPVTAGVPLLWGSPSWRRFAGWWLLAAGLLAFGSLLWFLPPYQGWPQSLVVGSATCVLPPIALSAFLLIWAGRKGRAVER
jgi:hypothetical protein